MSYYNTTASTGEILKHYEKRAVNQETYVLSVFANCPILNYTATEVYEYAIRDGFKWPITSIRRAITNLYKGGWITKTNIQRKGQYDILNYAYQYRK